MHFQRGFYDEILPIWPETNISSNDVLRKIVNGEDYAKKMIPTERAVNDAETILYIHQQRLQQILLTGTGNPDTKAIYQAVMRGEPLSLLPPEISDLEFKTFVPILQRTGDNQWQVGITNMGHYVILFDDTLSALQQGWQFYIEWMKVEIMNNMR